MWGRGVWTKAMLHGWSMRVLIVPGTRGTRADPPATFGFLHQADLHAHQSLSLDPSSDSASQPCSHVQRQ